MIKHSAILAVFVVFLVGTLLYSMSPDELRIAYAGIRHKVSDAAEETLRAMHGQALRIREIHPLPPGAPLRRKLMPDPFRPYATRQAAAGRIPGWILGPQWLWSVPAAGVLLWLGRRVRRKRFQFAAEQKMAFTLVTAVRHMSNRPGKALTTTNDV
jgi:hypothetical protein